MNVSWRCSLDIPSLLSAKYTFTLVEFTCHLVALKYSKESHYWKDKQYQSFPTYLLNKKPLWSIYLGRTVLQPEELLVTVALHSITILLFYNLHVLYTLSVLLGKYIYIYKYYTCITATRTISSSFQFSIYPGKKRNPYKTSIVKDLLQSMLLTTYTHGPP